MRERSKNMKEQKKNKGCVLAAESSYNAQNIQFSLVLLKKKKKKRAKKTTMEGKRCLSEVFLLCLMWHFQKRLVILQNKLQFFRILKLIDVMALKTSYL